MNDIKTPGERSARTFFQTVLATIFAFLYGLWKLPGVSEYTHKFIQDQGPGLLVSAALLIGIPAAAISYFMNRRA